MPASQVRVRFAPSPTGYLHVGSAQSALFNWLYARHVGGRFLLRIEDTDATRNRPELTDNILEMLRWLGLDWDEDPVHQSERGGRYAAAATQLVGAGAAYACDCTPEAVQARVQERGGPPGYDGHCRDRGLEPGVGRALRLKVPRDGSVAWHDLIRGEVRFEHRNLEDVVLVRSSGAPTFVLANAVDDLDMGITHVIRGEDHVNSTPKYLLVRAALGEPEPPVFAHLPLLVNEARKKLSKRRDDVSVADYRDRGFLPDAMRNYLALLGWGPPDGVEVRPLDEIVTLFELGDVNASPAFFDVKKLTHINGEYLRALPVEEFIEAATPFLPDGAAAVQALVALAPLVQERVKTLAEVEGYVDFLYLDEPPVDEASWDKAMVRGKAAPDLLDATITGLEALEAARWTAAAIRGVVEQATVALGFVNTQGRPQLAKTQGPVRVATTGRMVGPPLFESLEVLGRERTLRRLRTARSRLG